MIFTLAFCFSDLFWYILRWANDSMHKILQLFIISYFLCICKTKYIIFLQFHQFLHFVFEGTKTGGLSAEYVCYGLFFVCLIKSVMNTRTGANGLTCLLTITYPAIILRLLSYSIIQRGVQQKCNTETEKLKNFFSITIAIPWISTLVDAVDFGVSNFVFHDKCLHFVFEGTKRCGLSAEYVYYGLLFMCLFKSVMNTRTTWK